MAYLLYLFPCRYPLYLKICSKTEHETKCSPDKINFTRLSTSKQFNVTLMFKYNININQTCLEFSFNRDVVASAVYMLVYERLVDQNPKPLPMVIVSAGGIAGITITSFIYFTVFYIYIFKSKIVHKNVLMCNCMYCNDTKIEYLTFKGIIFLYTFDLCWKCTHFTHFLYYGIKVILKESLQFLIQIFNI